MNDRREAPSASCRPKRAAVRRSSLAGRAAGAVLAALATAAAAEDKPAPATATGSAEFRINPDFDLSADSRQTARKLPKQPYSVGDDQTPMAPFGGDTEREPSEDDPRNDGDASPDESSVASPPPLRKPKIDLFDEPPGARTPPSNTAAPPAAREEAGRSSSPPTGASGGKTSRLPRDRAGAGTRKPAGVGSAEAGPAGDEARRQIDSGPIRGGRLSLPSAPVRSSRTETLDGRLNLRAAPLRGTFPPLADDPFAPIGLRLGSFILYAALDQSAGYSSNLDESPNGAGGAFSDSTLSARLVSDWSRHAAELDMLANYRRGFGGETLSDPDIAIDGRMRLDVDRLTVANLRAGFVYRKEDATDLDSVEDVGGEKPNLLNYSASADLQHEFGDAFARGTVSAIRETKDREGRAGALDENFNTYTGALRAGYRISPAIAPFAEGSIGRRIFDDELDAVGKARDSTIASLRGGVSVDFGEKLTGEIAAGYAWNDPDSGAAKTAASPTVDAKIAWSPQRGTDVALTASTVFDPDTTGLTTSTLYQAGLAAHHRATARLDLNTALIAGYRDSELRSETEQTWGASVGFTYWINRSFALIGLASHDDVNRLHSPGDYDVDTVKLGVRIQN